MVKPYPLLQSAQLYSMPEPEFLIDNVIIKNSITGITSAPGTGKTWFTLEMLRGLVGYDSFLGKFPCREASALFVGSDASVMDYAQQWRKLSLDDYRKFSRTDDEIERGLESENPFDYNVRFLLHSDFLFESLDSIRQLIRTSADFHWGDPSLRQAGGYDTDTHFSLIVFDTLSKLTRMDQNNNSQMEEVFRNIRFLAEQTGSSIVILHHNAYANEFNDGESWRGATAQIGALDNWLQLTPDKGNKNRITVKFKKFRGLTPDPFTYEMRISDSSASLRYLDTASEAKFEDGILDACIAYLRLPAAEEKWFTTQQIASGIWSEFEDLFGKDKQKFIRAVRNRLEEHYNSKRSLVTKKGGGSKGNAAYYTLAKEG